MVSISIGGIVLGIEGEAVGGIPDPLKPYLVDDQEPEVSCFGGLGAVDGLKSGETLFDSGGVWRLDRGRSGPRLVLRNGGADGVPYQVLDLTEDLLTGEATLDARILGGEEPFALRDPLLELWYSFLLMRGRGLLVHGLGVLLGEEAHVFLGESGAGKSTLGHVFDDAGVGEILSDDRLVFRPEGDGFRVYGTPWHGEDGFSSPSGGRIASISFLAKDPDSRLDPVASDEAAHRLIECCFLAGWPRVDVGNALGMCVRLARTVPCGVLRFSPDRTALEALGVL